MPRSIRYFPGVQTPMKDSELVSMTVFRENTEDIYAGIEWPAGSPEAQKLMKFLQDELNVHAVRFPSSSGLRSRQVAGGDPQAEERAGRGLRRGRAAEAGAGREAGRNPGLRRSHYPPHE